LARFTRPFGEVYPPLLARFTRLFWRGLPAPLARFTRPFGEVYPPLWWRAPLHVS